MNVAIRSTQPQALAEPQQVFHYPIQQFWPVIGRHFKSKRPRRVLYEDLNVYAKKRLDITISPGMLPWQFEKYLRSPYGPCKTGLLFDYAGLKTRMYTLNFQLMVAQEAAPERPWRIVHNGYIGTVFDGAGSLFDVNAIAYSVAPSHVLNCLLKTGQQKKPGELIDISTSQTVERLPEEMIAPYASFLAHL